MTASIKFSACLLNQSYHFLLTRTIIVALQSYSVHEKTPTHYKSLLYSPTLTYLLYAAKYLYKAILINSIVPFCNARRIPT